MKVKNVTPLFNLININLKTISFGNINNIESIFLLGNEYLLIITLVFQTF